MVYLGRLDVSNVWHIFADFLTGKIGKNDAHSKLFRINSHIEVLVLDNFPKTIILYFFEKIPFSPFFWFNECYTVIITEIAN